MATSLRVGSISMTVKSSLCSSFYVMARVFQSIFCMSAEIVMGSLFFGSLTGYIFMDFYF